MADQSAPDSNHFFWAYTVLIENGGPDTVQLRARYWRIIDANGRTIEVKGAGVVGQQPILRPGETFEYKSGTPLETPSGMMLGAYQMQTADGEAFQVDIPVFPLDSPHEVAAFTNARCTLWNCDARQRGDVKALSAKFTMFLSKS